MSVQKTAPYWASYDGAVLILDAIGRLEEANDVNYFDFDFVKRTISSDFIEAGLPVPQNINRSIFDNLAGREELSRVKVIATMGSVDSTPFAVYGLAPRGRENFLSNRKYSLEKKA